MREVSRRKKCFEHSGSGIDRESAGEGDFYKTVRIGFTNIITKTLNNSVYTKKRPSSINIRQAGDQCNC